MWISNFKAGLAQVGSIFYIAHVWGKFSSCLRSFENFFKIKNRIASYRDKLQNEVDQFDEWAKTQSDIDTQLNLELEEQRGK